MKYFLTWSIDKKIKGLKRFIRKDNYCLKIFQLQNMHKNQAKKEVSM